MYAIEMGSGGMIYIPSSVTFGSGIYVTYGYYRKQFERL
jgi:hypothetical protein